MIRIILYLPNNADAWKEGVLHSFIGESAVVEDLQTAELHLVPVVPTRLKFKITTEKWIEAQVVAQRQQQARNISAGTPPPTNR